MKEASGLELRSLAIWASKFKKVPLNKATPYLPNLLHTGFAQAGIQPT